MYTVLPDTRALFLSHLIINHLTVKLDFAHLAFGEHVPMLLTPLLECHLDGLIAVDRNKVAIFVSVP